MNHFAPYGAEQPVEWAAPPVSPEVINILLLWRSCRMHDALSEHVVAMEISGRSMSQSSFVCCPTGSVQAKGKPYLARQISGEGELLLQFGTAARQLDKTVT